MGGGAATATGLDGVAAAICGVVELDAAAAGATAEVPPTSAARRTLPTLVHTRVRVAGRHVLTLSPYISHAVAGEPVAASKVAADARHALRGVEFALVKRSAPPTPPAQGS